MTFDGLLQPLGQSQVLRYVEGLSDRGWRFIVLSFERESDLADSERVRTLADRLAERDIEWVHRVYRTPGARNVLTNLADATAVALELAADRPISLTHARSYLGAGIALALRRSLDVPYLFDMRGFWIDELLEEGRWFTNPAALAAGRFTERALFDNAAAVVSLAKPAAEDIAAGRFGPWDRPLEVIPTCVDEDKFRLGPPPQELVPHLHDKLVIGYVGSLNRSYRVRESFAIARAVLEARPDAHLLCLTAQENLMSEELDRAHIAPSRRTITRVNHQQIHDWLRLFDWGLLLLNEPFAKRGSMPTKLAEFFATGIRPIAYGCNEEVVDWVRRAGSGIVLDACTPRGLRAAAAKIAELGKRPRDIDPVGARAREIAMPHFSATAGVERYHELYERLQCRGA